MVHRLHIVEDLTLTLVDLLQLPHGEVKLRLGGLVRLELQALRLIGMRLEVVISLPFQLRLVLLVLGAEALLVGVGKSSRAGPSRRLHLRLRHQAVGEELEDVVVVGQATGRRRDAKVAKGREEDVLRAQTQLVVVLVVGVAAVEHHRQHVLVVLNLGADGKGLVAKVAQAALQLLVDAVGVVVVALRAVIDHRHHVGVVALVVVVEGVEEEGEALPVVGRAEDRPLRVLDVGVPEGEAVGADAALAVDAEHQLHLPPVEGGLGAGPDLALLRAQRGRDADHLLAGDGRPGVLPEGHRAVLLRQVGALEGVLVLEAAVSRLHGVVSIRLALQQRRAAAEEDDEGG